MTTKSEQQNGSPCVWLAAFIAAFVLWAVAIWIWFPAAKPQNEAWLKKLILAAALLSLIWIDLKVFRLPDMITYSLMASGLLFSVLKGAFLLAVLGAAFGYVIIFALRYAYLQKKGQEGIGLGDAKLSAAGGAWLGVFAVPHMLLFASLIGLLMSLVYKKSQSDDGPRYIPFGPALALSIWCLSWLPLERIIGL